MRHASLKQVVRSIALPGYGYPDEMLVWLEQLPAEYRAAMHEWATRERYRYVELREPDGARRAFWLIPRTALG